MFTAPIDETTGSTTLWYIDNPGESLFHFFWHVTHWDIYDLLSFEYPLQIIFFGADDSEMIVSSREIALSICEQLGVEMIDITDEP